MLVLLGDDHISKSSTIAHQSEFAMLDAQIPILNPSNLEDLFNYGIFAWSLSRYSGLWVSMKCITANMDSSASIKIDLNNFNYIFPTNLLKNDVHIKANEDILEQEKRMYTNKIPAAIEFASLNNINTHLWKPKKKKLGIISTGKAFSDTIDTLSILGVSEKAAKDLGIHLLKIGMSWPLDTKKIESFAAGLDEILIIEEKDLFLESHVRNHLYNFKKKPKRIVGKYDENYEKLINENYQLSKTDLKKIISSRISKTCDTDISVNKVILEKVIRFQIKIIYLGLLIFVLDAHIIPLLKFLKTVRLWQV